MNTPKILIAKVALRFYFRETLIAKDALRFNALKNSIAKVVLRFYLREILNAKVVQRFNALKIRIALVALDFFNLKKNCAVLHRASVIYSEKVLTSAHGSPPGLQQAYVTIIAILFSFLFSTQGLVRQYLEALFQFEQKQLIQNQV